MVERKCLPAIGNSNVLLRKRAQTAIIIARIIIDYAAANLKLYAVDVHMIIVFFDFRKYHGASSTKVDV